MSTTPPHSDPSTTLCDLREHLDANAWTLKPGERQIVEELLDELAAEIGALLGKPTRSVDAIPTTLLAQLKEALEEGARCQQRQAELLGQLAKEL